LATPIFMQVTIDKILVHSAGATLLIVVIGLLVIGAFDVTLQYLRSYALSHTASRIDVDLNRKVFNHLLKLPLAYFEGNPTGQVIARVREVDSIRAFLTGRGLKALIDISFAVVFILVMFSYSSSLTLVVVLLMPLYIVIIATIMPVLRRRFQSRFKANAAAQQFLIESVIGMQTIKAAAIEATRESQWNERRGAFAQNDFESNVLNNLGQNLVLYVSQLITVSILFFGVRAVMAAEMTIGELIAFNMIAGQVVLPIIRVVEAWQEFQSVHVSVERLGDMMNSPKEVQSGLLTDLPLIQGDVTFRNVSFRYSDEAGDVLQDVSLDIQAGQVIGVVGASGSGKSTLAKLMQRFYIAQRGRVAIDGIDVARVHPRWLRQQIGVVVQDSVLFNRTIHQNIALVTPYMTREQVVAVARLAGAHEFIMSLPRGYDTVLDERGTNLSSGQRQRIALARGLAHDPRILILDEATSSVDYETERTIQRNMKEMVRGRTVIVIAHRLMTVRNCDRILTVEQGRIVEDGTHDELMRIENGRYRRLWSLQSDQNA